MLGRVKVIRTTPDDYERNDGVTESMRIEIGDNVIIAVLCDRDGIIGIGSSVTAGPTEQPRAVDMRSREFALRYIMRRRASSPCGTS